MTALAGAGAVGLSMPPTSAWGFLAVDLDRSSYLSWNGRIMLDKLTRSVFSDVIGSAFKFRLEDGQSMDVNLVEATDLKRHAPNEPGLASRNPFSVVFRGPADTVLQQMTYRVEHEKIGKFDVFIVPIGPDDEGMRYEAIFS